MAMGRGQRWAGFVVFTGVMGQYPAFRGYAARLFTTVGRFGQA